MISVPKFDSLRNTSYDQLDDPTKGAFFNFMDNPNLAAKNTVRSMGGNPRINPYAARLANKASMEATLAQIEKMLGGEMPDNDGLRDSVIGNMGRGLLPNSQARGQDILRRLADITSIEDEDSAGLSTPQALLRTMFSGGAGGFKGDAGQGAASSNIIQMLMGMGLPSAFGSFLDDTFKERMQGFQDYYAPSNPNKGFFDFLLGGG